MNINNYLSLSAIIYSIIYYIKTYLKPIVHFNTEHGIYIFQDLEWIAESLSVKNGYFYMQDSFSINTDQQAVFYFSDSDDPVLIIVFAEIPNLTTNSSLLFPLFSPASLTLVFSMLKFPSLNLVNLLHNDFNDTELE